MPKMIMLSGPSGSGKSTLAFELMKADGNLVRINRDDLRKMSIIKWTPKREEWIISAELYLARAAALLGKNILIDDTNLTQSDEDRWKNHAAKLIDSRGKPYSFEKRQLNADLGICVERDSFRQGNARVGRPTIERQFLKGKLWDIPQMPCPDCMGVQGGSGYCYLCNDKGTINRKTVIFDIDGTLADLTHRTPWITIGAICPSCDGKGGWKVSVKDIDYSTNPVTITHNEKQCGLCEGTGKVTHKDHDTFYSLVHKDKPIDIVVRWIQECYKHYHVVIVSGRSPEKCGEETCQWLTDNWIPYHHIIMRRSNCHGPDVDEKQLILNDILKIIPRSQIAFVVDDRPSVVDMWRKNALTVIPVRGRDDDKFYELMDELEVTHPQAEE